MKKFGQGALQAFLRKGIRELAAITEAFPTSLQVFDEPGQLWSVTQQAASQQTGVSMPVHHTDKSPPENVIVEPSEPTPTMEAEAPAIDIPQEPSVVETLVAEAELAQPERELEQQMEPG